jgi:hypothetical protein
MSDREMMEDVDLEENSDLHFMHKMALYKAALGEHMEPSQRNPLLNSVKPHRSPICSLTTC